MEDDKGLELSLGLACGGSSSASKDKSGNSADGRTDTDERTSKILNDFRNFLSAGGPQSFQRTDPVKSQDNCLNNVQQTATGENVSGNGLGAGDNKRKSMFDEMNNQKKQETDSRSSDKGKPSHISITTDEEGSTGDNEDVAESEAEGSTSRIISNREDGSRTPVGSVSSSQAPKEIHGISNSGVLSYSPQTMTTSGVPYSITIKESSSLSAPSTPSYALSGMMQGINPRNGNHPGQHTTTPGNAPRTFGYSPVQIPDKDNAWGMVARSQALHSPYAGRPLPTSVSHPSLSEAARLDVRVSEQLKCQSKVVAEEGSSSQSDDNAKGQTNSFPSEYPAIRPGIAAEVNFGGSGSFPNLPWVSTTGPGPHGKTISGVTYKYNATQIKIVCACHGVHMSPEEFVRHASEEQPSAVSTPGIASVRSSNAPPTSA